MNQAGPVGRIGGRIVDEAGDCLPKELRVLGELAEVRTPPLGFAENGEPEAVEGGDRDLSPEPRFDALGHLLLGLPGKGEEQNLGFAGETALQNEAGSRHQHTRLTRAGTGKDKRRILTGQGGPPLALGQRARFDPIEEITVAVRGIGNEALIGCSSRLLADLAKGHDLTHRFLQRSLERADDLLDVEHVQLGHEGGCCE